MKNTLAIVFFIWQIVCVTLSASPVFDQSNANLWVMDTNTGQMSAYRYQAGSVNSFVWTEDFLSTGYTLQTSEQALVNNLAASSSSINDQLAPAPISLAGLAATDLIVGVNSGMQPLRVTPASGGFSDTIMVEMAVDVNLTNNGPVSLKWRISGNTTGVVNGGADLTSSSELRSGQLYARFYLVQNDTYTITVSLLDNTQTSITSQVLSYSLNNTDPQGKRRDTDKDGLPDLVELAIGLDPLNEDWTYDRNDNGWSDFDEWLRDLKGTDGLPLDSDNDGWSDFDEGLRGTNNKDLVQTLITSDSTYPAPATDSLEYKQKLRLFQDIPAASSLYEVEYVVSALAVEIQGNTNWLSFSSYIPGSGIIFDSDELLTEAESNWAKEGFINIPDRRLREKILSSLIINNKLIGLRLPAGRSQVLDIRGNNKQTINAGLENETEEIRSWHLLQWLNEKTDLTPVGFDAGTTWQTADEWKSAFIVYLSANLKQDLDVKLDINSTTNASLLLAVLAKEYALTGGEGQLVFNQQDDKSKPLFESLQRTLLTREKGRTFDDVYADLLLLSATDMPLQASADLLKINIINMPWKQDSLRSLFVYATEKTTENPILSHISRLALFADGVSELAADATLSAIDADSDGDGLVNVDELVSDRFSNSTYPWKMDSDGDLALDANDACPLDAQNLCQSVSGIPQMTLSGSDNFDITLNNAESSYIVATIQLDRAYEQSVSADYNVSTLFGDAVAGVDFDALSGTVFIPAGETSATIIITLPATGAAGSKTFYLSLSNELNAMLPQADYLVTVNQQTVPGLPVISAYYSTAPNWNDYVKNDNTTQFDATNTPADGLETGGYSALIHGGEMRAVNLGIATCTDQAATDALGVFNWVCDDSSGSAVMVSTGLKKGINLSDLLDFVTPGWKTNSLTVTGTAAVTTTTEVWWNNPVTLANTGGSLATSGTVYVVTANPAATYKMDTDNISLVIQPGVTLTGDASALFGNLIEGKFTLNFIWVEGTLDVTGGFVGLYWYRTKFSVLRNLSVSNAFSYGVYLRSKSSNNSLSNITASNNEGDGIYFDGASSYNSLSNATVTNSGEYGIHLYNETSNNSLSDITSTNNVKDGIYLQLLSNNNRLLNITVANNGRHGVYIYRGSNNNRLTNIIVTNNLLSGVYLDFFVEYNSLSNIISTGNGDQGVYFNGALNNDLSNVTAANNGKDGIYFLAATNNTLSNIAAVNSGANGVSIITSSGNSLLNMAATNNTNLGIRHSSSSDSYFTGLLKVGLNANGNCQVAAPFVGGLPGLVDVTCANEASSDATLSTGATLAASFVGKVMSDDSVNGSDATGAAASYPVDSASFDWVNFDSIYRGWGIDGSAFPNIDQQGQWTTGAGRIWDWSLANGDTGDAGNPALQNVLTVPSNGNAANTIEHAWKGVAANQAACTALVADSVFNAIDDCRSTYLRNASEIVSDNIGNDNGLCESGETCLFTPNIGAYQGHGALISAGTFVDGDTLTGITLMKYTTNGY